MVIIVSREGQLANRIWHASSFIVNAKEYNYKILHLFFDNYYEIFSENLDRQRRVIKFFGKEKTKLVSFFQESITFITKVLLKLRIKKLPFFEIIEYGGYEQEAEIFDLNREEFVRKARSKLILVHGWLFRDPVNQQKHRSLLLETWTPNKNYRENVERYFKKYKDDHDLLIGVHIRGGDYKKFEGGKWFYTPEQYYDKIKEAASLNIFAGKRIGFVICTNEKNVSFPVSTEFSVFNEERHFVEDLYLLAKCDYIIGPPSTFSIWASFYGGVPLHFIHNLHHKIDPRGFVIH